MSFSIRSSSSDQEAVFSNRIGELFDFELIGTVSVRHRISTHTDNFGLNKLFQQIAAMEKPWHGQITWESLEGEFKISVSCSPLGIVQFNLSLWGLPGHPEEWRVETGLVTEFGQLERIARQAHRFFGENT